MPNQYFKFKQFTIHQEKSAMKVGTDGVLIGAWAPIDKTTTILDIGTGTGLISIMLAQRSNATIDAVEIDKMSARQAKENMKNCPWTDRLSCYHQSFQEFAAKSRKKYDLIVSNPPYFIKSQKSPELTRTLARHSEQLPYPDLLLGIDKLLSHNGRFAGIFPYAEGNIFIAQASAYDLYCTERVNVLGKKGGPVKRLLLKFCRQKEPLKESTIAIRQTDNEFTSEYKTITKDFYLAF